MRDILITAAMFFSYAAGVALIGGAGALLTTVIA